MAAPVSNILAFLAKPFHALAIISLLLIAGNSFGATNRFIADGNSITHGTGETPWLDMFRTNIGLPWGVTNVAVNGATTFDQIGRLSASVFPNSLPSADWNFVHILEGGNSLYYGSNATAAFLDLSNYCYQVTANGQRPVIGTVFPRFDLLSDPTKAAALTNLNVLISNNWHTFAFGIIHYATNVLLDPVQTPASFQGDGIHPTTAGAFAIANQAADGIRAIAQRITIGSESSLPVYSGQNYRGTIGDRPDDAAVETLNPPLFHWIYMEQPYSETNWFGGGKRTFQFQLTTNGNWSNLYWDIATSNNFYNTLPPITNANGTAWAGSNYWRVIYYDGNHSTAIATSSVHHFTLSATASNWDRAMLADSNYLHSKLSVHPHLFFHPTNATAALTFMQTGYVGRQSWTWATISNSAISTLTNEWFTNETLLTNGAGYTHSYMTPVALTYVVDSNALIAAADPATLMDKYARWWTRDPYWIGGALNTYEHEPVNVYALPIMYDSFYNIATATQRSNMLWAMECSVARYIGESWWFYGGGYPDRTNVINYSGATMVPQGAGKQGYSHQRVDGHAGLLMCLAGWAESAFLREMFPYFLNYVIAKKDPADMNDGRSYNYSFTINPSKEGIPEMMAIWNFPEAQLQRSPIYLEMAKIFAHMEPQHYRANGQAWGDYGYGMGWTQPLTFTDERWHYWSRVLNHGALYKQWVQESGPSGTLITQTEQPFFAALSYYYPAPAQSNWVENSYIDVHRGFALINSKQPNDVQAFSNSVGVITLAAPGITSDHHSSGQGGLEMWAYGAMVSAHGGGQSKHPIAQWGMTFVDGYGPFNVSHGWNITNIQARFTSWTNHTNFAYVASDTKEAYNRHQISSDGLYDTVLLFYKTNKQAYLTSMKRHFLFPHKKYLVLYDEMTSSTNAVFQKLFHTMETNNLVVNTSACSFTYTATNHFHGSNVTVHIVPFVNPSLMWLTNMPGQTNYYVNPFTGEQPFYFDDIADWPRGHIWLRNRTVTTNWHFGYVVYPQKWDEPTPIFTRLNDFKVQVAGYTHDGTAWRPTVDVITADTNDTSNTTLVLNVGATFQNEVNTNPPGAFTFTLATPGDTQISLGWSASENADGYHISYYKTLGGSTSSVFVASTSTTVTSLINQTNYTFLAVATNAYGVSDVAVTNGTPVAAVAQPRILNANRANAGRFQAP